MSNSTTAMERIASAVALGQSGGRAPARRLLGEMRAEVENGGDPLERCALAHALADLQDDPHAELAWDLHALDAADALSDDRLVEAGGAVSARGFYPSLHLNVAECCRKVGDVRRAEEHLRLARAFLAELGGDPYGGMLLDAFDRLEARLRLTVTGSLAVRGAGRPSPNS